MNTDPRQAPLFDLPEVQPARPPVDPVDYLPDSLKSLLDAGVSVETVRALVEAFPGCRASIPKPGATSGQLVDAIGVERANEIARAVSGVYFYVPACSLFLRAARNRDIRTAYDAKVPMAEICKRFKTTENNVRRILAE